MASVSPASPSPTPLSPSPQVPSPLSSDTPQPLPPASATKLGRCPTFTPGDDIIIVREVAAAKAHVAPFGEVLKRFAEAAEKANRNPNLSAKVTTKRLQDRYKKLMEAFAKKDGRERMMSGVGGELGELEDLLSAMLDAQRDLKATKNAEKTLREAQENRKDVAGRRLMQTVMERAGNGNAGRSGSAGEDGKERSKRGRLLEGESDEGLEALASSLQKTDMARVEIERERLALDRNRMEREVADRAAERELKREEREARDKLELDKFRLMMETFASARK